MHLGNGFFLFLHHREQTISQLEISTFQSFLLDELYKGDTVRHVCSADYSLTYWPSDTQTLFVHVQ